MVTDSSFGWIIPEQDIGKRKKHAKIVDPGNQPATYFCHGESVSRNVLTRRCCEPAFEMRLECCVMKSRETLIRLKRFQADEKQRRVAQIEAMIEEFGRMIAELDREIAAEEHRSGNNDPAHFAYSTYARAARTRRENLRNSADELSGQLAGANVELEEALAELHKAENLEGREKNLDRATSMGASLPPLAMNPVRV